MWLTSRRRKNSGLVSVLYLGDVVNIRLGGFGVSTEKIRSNPSQIVRTIRATLKGVRFLKNNKPESLAIMRDYLNVSADGAVKIHDFSLRSLNVDGRAIKMWSGRSNHPMTPFTGKPCIVARPTMPLTVE